MSIEIAATYVGSIVLDKVWDSIQKFAQSRMSHVLDAVENEVVEKLATLFGSEALPSTALIGFGHCGTGILYQLAEQFELAETASEVGQSPKRMGLLERINSRFAAKGKSDLEIRDLKPLVVVGDLDESNKNRRKVDYSLYREMGLKILAVAGTGNMPAKAQFLARVALNSPHLPPDSGFPWAGVRAALIDSLGADARNRIRLVVYVFSTGGGSGSGFLYEVAQAQRFKQIQRLASPTATASASETPDVAFTLGAAVMPGISGTVDAQSLNTGRLLCRYLADRWGASNEKGITAIPAYHGLVLFSNGSFHSNESLDLQIAAANEFISDQLLTAVFAQDAGKSGEQKQRSTGSQDQIRLDPSDLRHAICGVTLVGFYDRNEEAGIARSLILALGRPKRVNSRYVGMSVDAGTFDIVEDYTANRIDLNAAIGKLSSLPVFRFCPGVTVVISGPLASLTGQVESDLKRHLGNLFPNARVRRHAVLEGEPSITIYLSESGIFCEEAQRHLANYIYNCFFEDGTEHALLRENLTTVIGGECKPLSIIEAQVFLNNVAVKLGSRQLGNGLFDVLLSIDQARDCLEYVKKLQTLVSLKDGLPSLEEFLGSGAGRFRKLTLDTSPVPK